MTSSPNLFLAAISVVAIALAGVIILLGLIWTQLRALPMDKTARLVDDLSQHQDALETLLARVESGADVAGPTAPAPGSSPGPRVDRPDDAPGRRRASAPTRPRPRPSRGRR